MKCKYWVQEKFQENQKCWWPIGTCELGRMEGQWTGLSLDYLLRDKTTNTKYGDGYKRGQIMVKSAIHTLSRTYPDGNLKSKSTASVWLWCRIAGQAWTFLNTE